MQPISYEKLRVENRRHVIFKFSILYRKFQKKMYLIIHINHYKYFMSLYMFIIPILIVSNISKCQLTVCTPNEV